MGYQRGMSNLFLKSKNHQIGTKTFTESLNNSPKGVGEVSTKVKEGGLKVKLGMLNLLYHLNLDLMALRAFLKHRSGQSE